MRLWVLYICLWLLKSCLPSPEGSASGEVEGIFRRVYSQEEWERIGSQADDIKYAEFVFLFTLFSFWRNKTVAGDIGAILGSFYTSKSLRSCLEFCLCSKTSLGSLFFFFFFWTWSQDLQFWNHIWSQLWKPNFSSKLLESILGLGLSTNTVMRVCDWEEEAGVTSSVFSTLNLRFGGILVLAWF